MLLTQALISQLTTQLDSNDSNDALFKIITLFAMHSSSLTNIDFQHANHNCNIDNIKFELMLTMMLSLDHG